MKRFVIVAAGVAAGFLLLALGAASTTHDQFTPPTLLSPAAGQVFQAGTHISFRVATHPGDGFLWLLVSRSPSPVRACGTIDDEVDLERFVATSDPSVYEAAPRYFDYAEFWMNAPGTYYWQAYRIEHAGGADGCIESPVRSLRIVPKAAPAPKAPAAVSQARLAGEFSVTTRVTSVSGLDNVRRGSVDSGDWRFTPQCAKGACSVTVRFSYGIPGSARATTIRLKKAGAAYAGSGAASLTTCMFKPVPGHMTVSLKVTGGAWLDGVWRATRVSGTYRYSAGEFKSGAFRCKASSVAATVRGTLDRGDL